MIHPVGIVTSDLLVGEQSCIVESEKHHKIRFPG